MAAAATVVHADDAAGVVHRAIGKEPDDIRRQDGECDPQGCLGRSIHLRTEYQFVSAIVLLTYLRVSLFRRKFAADSIDVIP